MNFENYLTECLLEESKKLILRYHSYHNGLHLDYLRNAKRVINTPPKEVKVPSYWSHDKKFNPFYVRKKAKSIARAIANKIADKTYKPEPPYIKKIKKPSGGFRNVAIYQIPDATVSRIFYERLLSKNKHRFSAFSYAYRNDRNVHFAIQDISIDISRDARSFVAEFDFSDFFGSISHEYLRAQFNSNGFFISDEERFIIDVFLGV